MYESKDKMVSHPKHYQGKNGIEVIDVIKAFTEDLSGIEASDTANIIKYACRWKQKGGIQDLEKILWYTQHLIDYLEGNEECDDVEDEETDEFECDGNCEDCEFYDPEDDEDEDTSYEIRIYSASDSEELRELIKNLLSDRLFADDDDDKKQDKEEKQEDRLMDIIKKSKERSKKHGSLFDLMRRYEM